MSPSDLYTLLSTARRKYTNLLTNNLICMRSDSQVLGEYGMAHFSEWGNTKGKDYCIFFNSQWARLPQDLSKAVSSNLHFTHTHTNKFRLKLQCTVYHHNAGTHSPFIVFQARLQTYDLTTSVLCSPSDVPEGGFPNSIPMVMRGNCTFYEKVRLAQMNGAKGLLIVSKDRLVRLYNTINSTIKTFSHVSQISLSDMLYRLLPQATSPSMRR